MNNNSFDVIRFTDLDFVRDKRIVKLVEFFSDVDVFSKILRQALSSNEITVPSLYSEGVATCKRGMFFIQNCLVFKDGYDSFVLTQLSSLLYGILDIKNKVFYSQEFNLSRQAPLIDGILKNLDLRTSEGKGFLGIINGYQRPYHYFTDKVPFFGLVESDLISSSTALSVRDKAFLPASFFGFKSEVIVDDLFEYIKCNKGFALDIGHPYRFSRKGDLNSLFDDKVLKVFSALGSEHFPDKSGSPVIWLGCCQEKRKWIELYDALEMFISEIHQECPGALYIFDGLTRPEYMDENLFNASTKVKNDISEIMKFVRKFQDLNFIILAGKSASEKLKWAFKTDFFITNALTDSMWCSRFAKKNGLCFSSRSARSEVLRNHKDSVTTIFPFEMVNDLGSDGDNFSKIDFSIDPYEFSKLALSTFSESYCSKLNDHT